MWTELPSSHLGIIRCLQRWCQGLSFASTHDFKNSRFVLTINIPFLIVSIKAARLTPVSPAERKIADRLFTVSHCHCGSSSVFQYDTATAAVWYCHCGSSPVLQYDTATAVRPLCCSMIPPLRFVLCVAVWYRHCFSSSVLQYDTAT